MRIPDRLRSLLQQHNETQTALAAHLGCSRPYINQVLHGRKKITLEMLEHACEFFGITLGDFFHDDRNLPLHIENFIAYCKDLSEQEISALQTVADLFPTKQKTDK